MQVSPFPSDQTIRAGLRTAWGGDAVAVERLPLGYDSDARVYRIDAADGRAYFLKLKLGTPDNLGSAVVRSLADRGIRRVVAPLPTIDGALRAEIGGVVAILYDFLDGQGGWETGLTVAQWREYGAILRRVHESELPPDLAARLPRETFVPTERWSRVVRDLLSGTGDGALDDDIAREASAFVLEKREEIGRLLGRAEELGRRRKEGHGPFVLCHADAHVGNVLVQPDGAIWLVDWDQPILAPRERDLMFVLGPALRGVLPGSPEEAAFFEAYGPVAPDPLALAYYRYEWAVQDIGSFADDALNRPDLSHEERQESARLLRAQFQPGAIAEAADRTIGTSTDVPGDGLR
jgi:spectinomycin phosphotransferase